MTQYGRQQPILKALPGGRGGDPEAAAREACAILLEATERALDIIDLPTPDRARLLRCRRSLSRAVGQRPLSLAQDPQARTTG